MRHKSNYLKRLAFRNPLDFFSGLVILIITIAFICLAGCGSGGSEGGLPLNGDIEITCSDVQEGYNGICDAVKEGEGALGLAALAVPSYNAIFNSGIVNTTAILSAEVLLSNNTAAPARIYLFTDMTAICGRLNTMTSNTMDIPSGDQALVPTIGSCFDVCASEGDTYYEVFIYNASHLPLDVYAGDPAIDELLYSGRVNFSFRAP